jgi:hypothetical protein
MPFTFTPDAELPSQIHSAGGLLALTGTLTFSGAYAAGGDVPATGKPNIDDLFKRIGRGKVFAVILGRGLDGEWVSSSRKLQLFTSGATEMAAAAYAAGYTASPVPVTILGR